MRKLIFDFDGTLVDSMGAYAGTMLRILDENGVTYPSDIMKTITPLGYVGTADYYVEQLGMTQTREELIAKMHAYCLVAYRDTIPAKATIADTLRALKAKGYSLNVLTASPHSMLDVCLKRLGLFDLFDNVWSCEDFATTKSDVTIYHRAAARLGTTADGCVFLDDNVNADRTAKAAGMLVVGVYDDSSADMTDEMHAVCDGYVTSMAELIPWLEEKDV